MKKVMGLMALGLSMVLLSGCSEDNDTPRIQGIVVGSHYEGAWVCVDSNSNDRCDDAETITVSDANGYWSLDDPQNKELNVVAEIYVDNIKHSNHAIPPSETLVEKPMIFIASLQGEIDDQIIVSPISTMVYRSMQENGVPFEVAKESVANELGVLEDVLLTDYNVEYPSSDQIAMQERSDVETEKLGLTMIYHDNKVGFWSPSLSSGKYVVTGFYIPSAQDPDDHIKLGTVVYLQYESGNNWHLNFVLGRSGSTSVADWWKRRVDDNQNNHNSNPGKLNFAMEGELTLVVDNRSYIFSNFHIAQGHSVSDDNTYWMGKNLCGYFDDGGSGDGVKCTGADENEFTVRVKFTNLAGYDSFEAEPY